MESGGCDFCGSQARQELGKFEEIQFGLPGEFHYARCQGCGLISLVNRPSPAEMERYYPAEYQPYRTAIQDEGRAWMRWIRQRNIDKYCRIVERYCTSVPGTILDVGCSTGIFLDAMHRRGWYPAGVETSETAVQYARDRFGLDVFHGQLTDADLEEERYDVVTLWNVFEHLYDPYETLQEAFRLLNKAGLLVLLFPSWESLERRLFKQYWVGYDAPRHLFVYSRPVYQQMIKICRISAGAYRNRAQQLLLLVSRISRG